MKTLVFAALLLAAPPYGPDDPVPPNAVRKVLDLKYRVIGLRIEGSAIAGKVESMKKHETATEVRLELAADVLFDFDKAELKPAAKETLANAAAIVKEKAKPGTRVRVEGHTDAKGSAAYNQGLSTKRAQTVADWLRANGADAVTYEITGHGAKKPVAPNVTKDGKDDPAGRAKNRRVEIVIKK